MYYSNCVILSTSAEMRIKRMLFHHLSSVIRLIKSNYQKEIITRNEIRNTKVGRVSVLSVLGYFMEVPSFLRHFYGQFLWNPTSSSLIIILLISPFPKPCQHIMFLWKKWLWKFQKKKAKFSDTFLLRGCRFASGGLCRPGHCRVPMTFSSQL